MSDIDNFLRRELKLRGSILNLVHHLTYYEIRRLLIEYHIEQTGNNTATLQQRQDKLPGEDKGTDGDAG